jgi:hypothetical protein
MQAKGCAWGGGGDLGVAYLRRALCAEAGRAKREVRSEDATSAAETVECLGS